MEPAIQWLLEGDPAIGWQTLSDLTGAGERTVEAERKKTALEGWGARLLDLQDPAGTWADGGLQHSYKGKTYFELEKLGAPSRWNTLRALRVLKWWDGAASGKKRRP